jgi:eukaryotic-like serine/threonine-protein kinase
MTADASNSDDRSRQIDAAIAEYLEALDQGGPPETEAFLTRHAAIAVELRSFLADYRAFQRDVPAAESTSQQTSDFANIAARTPFAITGDAPKTLRYFGDYELLQEIARGGMGIVFKARQTSLNRTVAVKMILAGQLASPAEVDRFYAEAQAAATLEHPNIVPIFEVGQHEQHQYFSMGYVAGESLAQRLSSGPLPPREAASIIAEVATAVHFAHGKGVIHRDLKPANILIDADGHPRITDFGLAKRQTDTSGLTVTGQVLGTPSFMPPEQISNTNGTIGPAARRVEILRVMNAAISLWQRTIRRRSWPIAKQISPTFLCQTYLPIRILITGFPLAVYTRSLWISIEMRRTIIDWSF